MTTDDPFWRGRRVAITGATGFVGHHLALALQGRAAVTALVRNLAKASRLSAAGVQCRIAALHDHGALISACTGAEFVFHLAGAVDFEENWQHSFEVNVEGTRNILAAARAVGVRRLIHTSSIVAVGAMLSPARFDERAAWNLRSLRIPYITTKRLAEEAVLAASAGPTEVVVVNPSSVIGPDDYSGSEFGILCRRFWRGRIPCYFGGGLNVVDVRDVASGHLLAAQHGQAGERYLLSGTNRTYADFFSDLARTAQRAIFRMRLPNVIALLAAKLENRLRRPGQHPYITDGQARLMGRFFFVDGAKAQEKLGYSPRPYHETLTATHAFWTTPRAMQQPI